MPHPPLPSVRPQSGKCGAAIPSLSAKKCDAASLDARPASQEALSPLSHLCLTAWGPPTLRSSPASWAADASSGARTRSPAGWPDAWLPSTTPIHMGTDFMFMKANHGSGGVGFVPLVGLAAPLLVSRGSRTGTQAFANIGTATHKPVPCQDHSQPSAQSGQAATSLGIPTGHYLPEADVGRAHPRPAPRRSDCAAWAMQGGPFVCARTPGIGRGIGHSLRCTPVERNQSQMGGIPCGQRVDDQRLNCNKPEESEETLHIHQLLSNTTYINDGRTRTQTGEREREREIGRQSGGKAIQERSSYETNMMTLYDLDLWPSFYVKSFTVYHLDQIMYIYIYIAELQLSSFISFGIHYINLIK